MKKLFLSLSSLILAISASAVDAWIWHGGEYIKTSVDSITFTDPTIVDPGEIVSPVGSSFYRDYNGTLGLTVMGFSAGTAKPTVSVTEVGAGIAKVAFSDFSASGYAISGFSADEVAVLANADGSYSLSQTNFTTTANLNGEAGELTKCSLTGKVTATGDISLSITFSVSGVPVGGSYSGN